MKSKKILLVLPFLILSGVAWVAAVNNGNEEDQTQKQGKLIETADMYFEDKAYIRALPIYQEAYNLDGDLTGDASAKIMEIYRIFGETRNYFQMMQERCDAGTAGEDEYIMLAQRFLDDSDYDSAIAVLDKGMKYYSDGELAALKKDKMYDYYISSNTFADVKLYGGDMIPVYDGQYWGYVNNKGVLSSDFIFEEATPFINGLAAVKTDNEYEIINLKNQRYSLCKQKLSELRGFLFSTESGAVGAAVNEFGTISFMNEEFYFSSVQYDDIGAFSNGHMAVCKNGKWGVADYSTSIVIEPKYDGFAVNKYNESFNCDRVFTLSGDKYILSDLECNALSSEAYDDARAFYAKGSLAAVKKNGKWGFINTQGDLVIDYVYDDADSFSFGLAAVKDFSGWKYINENNEIAIDTRYLDAGPFNSKGSAFVKTLNGWQMICRMYQ